MQNEEEGEMIASKDKDSISVKIIRLNAEFAPGVGELAIEYSLNKKTMNIIEKYPNENFDIILAIADNKDNIVYMHEQKAKEKEILTWNGFKDKDMKLPILYKNGPYKINISLIGGKKIESFSSIKSWQDFKDILYQKFYDDSLMYISTSIDTIFNILTDPIKLDWLAYNKSFPSSKSTQWYADFVVNCKSKGYFTDSLAKPLEWLINKDVLNTSASFCGQEVSEILPELAEMINLADSYLKNNYPDLYQQLVNSKKYIPGPATGVSMRYTSNGPSLHSFGASVDFRPTYNPYINSKYSIIIKYIKYLTDFDILKGPKTAHQSYNASKVFLEKLHGANWVYTGKNHKNVIDDYIRLSKGMEFSIDSLSKITKEDVYIHNFKDIKEGLISYLELTRRRVVFETNALEGLDVLTDYLSETASDTLAFTNNIQIETYFKEYKKFTKEFKDFSALVLSLNAEFETVKSNKILQHGFCDIEPEVYEAFSYAHNIITKRILNKTLKVDAGIIYNSSLDAMHFGLCKELVQFLTNNP